MSSELRKLEQALWLPKRMTRWACGAGLFLAALGGAYAIEKGAFDGYGAYERGFGAAVLAFVGLAVAFAFSYKPIDSVRALKTPESIVHVEGWESDGKVAVVWLTMRNGDKIEVPLYATEVNDPMTVFKELAPHAEQSRRSA